MSGLARFNEYLRLVEIDAGFMGEVRLAQTLAVMRTSATDQEVFTVARDLINGIGR